MHPTAKVVRTLPDYNANSELTSVTLQLRIERRYSHNASELLFSQPISGSVFFCDGYDNTSYFLENFEGSLLEPPLTNAGPGPPPLFNFQVLVSIPQRVRNLWQGGEWYLKVKVLLGSLTLEFDSEIYHVPVAYEEDERACSLDRGSEEEDYSTAPTPSPRADSEEYYHLEDSQEDMEEEDYRRAPTPDPRADSEEYDQQEDMEEEVYHSAPTRGYAEYYEQEYMQEYTQEDMEEDAQEGTVGYTQDDTQEDESSPDEE